MMKSIMNKKYLASLLVLTLFIFFYSGCSKKEEQKIQEKEQKSKDEKNSINERKTSSVDVKIRTEQTNKTSAQIPPVSPNLPRPSMSNVAEKIVENVPSSTPVSTETEKEKSVRESGTREKTAPEEKPKVAKEPVHIISMPDIERIVTPLDIIQISEKKVAFDPGKSIPGIADSDSYKSLYYTLKGKKDKYGFGIQIWKLSDPLKAKQKYQDLLSTMPHAQEITPVSNQTFFAYWENILYLSFSSLRDNFVLVLSCDKEICDSDRIYNLAKIVANRLK